MGHAPPLLVGIGPWSAAGVTDALRSRAAGRDDVRIVEPVDATDPAVAHLLVDGDERPDDGAVDVRLPADRTAAEHLWNERLEPFARNLARGRRAPRTQTVTVGAYDASWPAAAHRLGRRVSAGLGSRALLVEHVGSTSVPGMSGKDLVDLLVVVPDLATVDDMEPGDWHRTGLVRASGNLYGIDRHDREHPQRVAVDADPGRPVNVHLHPQASPVWRELLAFRDWLRSDAAHRDAYVRLKHRLAGQSDGDVNAYGRAKRAWVNDAVRRATSREGPPAP